RAALRHQLGAHRAVDDAAELPLFAGLVLEGVVPARPLAPEGEQRARRQVQPGEAAGLVGVAPPLGQHPPGRPPPPAHPPPPPARRARTSAAGPPPIPSTGRSREAGSAICSRNTSRAKSHPTAMADEVQVMHVPGKKGLGQRLSRLRSRLAKTSMTRQSFSRRSRP